MDPYLDAIPDDRGEGIKDLVRKRDGSDSEGRPAKRVGTDTSALLPPGGDEKDVEEPPKPEDDLDKYDRERLQKGLRYVDGAAKRKITPRTQVFLKLHKDAYEAALDGGKPEKASRAVVQAMDQVYSSAAFYFKPEDPDRLMHYVKLRRLELLANYGDYLGLDLQELRADLKAAAVGGSTEVQKAAGELGPPKTSLTIKEWAERNRTFDNQIRQYVTDCHWFDLAQQICRDLHELVNVAPDLDTAAKYEKVLVGIREDYFDVISDDDPHYWFPNETAKKLSQEKAARDKKRRGDDHSDIRQTRKGA
ncbi:MAG: hypothetical protein M1826_006440 [Phylliscum demangeonii]|nr:MAG: hypothetical protein M1826_006440 [Phylliscum demangeonii]